MDLHSHPAFGEFSQLGDLDLNIEWRKNSAAYFLCIRISVIGCKNSSTLNLKKLPNN